MYLNNLDSITTYVSLMLISDIKCEIVATHVPPSISTDHLSDMAIQPVELPSGHPLLLHQSVPREKQKKTLRVWAQVSMLEQTMHILPLPHAGIVWHKEDQTMCDAYSSCARTGLHFLPRLLFWKLLQRLHQEQLKSLEYCKDMTPSLMES